MKHKKCDICGFEAGRFSEIYVKTTGKRLLICVECKNRLKEDKLRNPLVKHSFKRVSEAKSRPQMRDDKQLKFQWYE